MSVINPIAEEGLSSREATQRLHDDGPNELPQTRRRTLWHMAGDVAREPMFQLLVAAALVYLMLGDRGEALMLLGFVAIIVAITLVQEHRTERVLEALRDLTSPRALVQRDGAPQRIPGREVVRGDLLVLADGDRISADALLLSAHDLQVDESLLTGEAVPVHKRALAPGEPVPDLASVRPGGDGQPLVYAGTVVVDGQALARVLATGARSQIGRIGQTLGTVQPPATPLHRQTRRLVRVFSVLGLALSLVVLVLYGLLRGDWLGGVLAGITLAMSMLPQEFLLILTVFMAMGAWRLSRQRVLARRAATIEALGAATTLCSDKTGTLTENRMAVAELLLPGGASARWSADADALPTRFHRLLDSAILASEVLAIDPMERACQALGARHLAPAGAAAATSLPPSHAGWTLVHEYGLSPALLAMTHVWQAPGEPDAVVATKGAPEAVAGLCRLDAAARQALLDQAQALAERGLRVLAVARARHAGADWPATPGDFNFELQGLVALADPLRPSVPAAIAECRAAGIRVLMITGDHPATARAIARQAGLDAGGTVTTGAELARLDDAALAARLDHTTVFARVLPEQKLRIVEALKARGEVVAMTGDGVNDAPSLKAAHIGIAMGGRGTDVAREASALVLLDDDFSAIVGAVRLGRRIFDNLRKAMAFVLAVHVPIAGLSLLPLLLGWPLLFLPVHIAFLELLIDPVCSIAFEAEAEEPDVMQRPPRDSRAPLFSAGLITWSLLQGGLVLVAMAGLLGHLLQQQVPEAEARATTFVALVCANLGLIVVNRSFSTSLWATLRRPNPVLRRIVLATLVLLAAALVVPPLRALFHFSLPAPGLLVLALASAVTLTVLVDAARRLGRSGALPARWRLR